ncbi:ABC transporter ATP-binding protein [Holophaga foetida]|uniref:ABC transporter ATP-binding protein n=1 Tax=Holophaga foetida TaxID=35839 RepID=UPI0002473EB3|nr:ABC transporter ATP-binding protein [Holophaga foetida]
MDAIRVEGLGRRFGEVVALDELSLRVAPGEIFGLVGPDGAGKTTTMRLLTGILNPTGGDAWVDGLHIVREADALKDRIGYMAQRFGLYPDLTVQENMDFYGDLYGVPRKGRESEMERLLAFSNLTPFRRRRAGNLSGGMKQKLGLACALIHTPKVLFLDEPTNGVDPVSRRDFWRILYQLQKEGVTIFVSTAYLDEAERCNRVALLHKGKLLALDTVEGVKGLLKGTLLELRSDRPREAARLLREARVGSVALFGDRVHILVAEGEAGQASIEATLKGSGMEVLGLKVIEPDLEDVFTSAIPREDA